VRGRRGKGTFSVWEPLIEEEKEEEKGREERRTHS